MSDLEINPKKLLLALIVSQGPKPWVQELEEFQISLKKWSEGLDDNNFLIEEMEEMTKTLRKIADDPGLIKKGQGSQFLFGAGIRELMAPFKKTGEMSQKVRKA